MPLIDKNNAIFYHPLDDKIEFTQNQIWDGDISFVPGKVINGATPKNIIGNFAFGSGNLLDKTFDDFSSLDRVLILPLDKDTALLHMGEYSVLFNISGEIVSTGVKQANLTRQEYTTAHRVSYSGNNGYALLTSFQTHPARQTQLNLVSVSGLTLSSIQSTNFTTSNGGNFARAAIDVFDDGKHALLVDQNTQAAEIVSISGGGFTSGIRQLVAPAQTPHDIATINTSGALVMFQDGNAHIANCDFINDIIIFGSGYSFSTSLDNISPTSHATSAQALYIGNNDVLITYRRVEATYGRIATVSGTTIIYGTEQLLSPGDSPSNNDWTTNFMAISQLSSNNILFSYEHRLNISTTPLLEDRFLKYRFLSISGTSITVGEERVWGSEKYSSNLVSMSPSSIVGGYRDGSSSAATDIFIHTANPNQQIDLSVLGVNYPSTSGQTHISTAMWAKNPFLSGNSGEILTKFGYEMRIRPSSILFGDDTNFDFVGSLRHGFATGASGDINHEGHEGQGSAFIRNNVSGYLNTNNADIVLLHIGTNDINAGSGVSGIRDSVSGICETIWSWGSINNIDTRIVLAKIINVSGTSSPDGITTTQFNGLLQTLGDDFLSAGKKISTVDMESALTYPDDMFDNAHPNASGYSKMASIWYPPLISGMREVRKATSKDIINIMPLGDSITQGFVVANGYRIELQRLLLSSGLIGATWDASGVQDVVATLNDGLDHFLITDFNNVSGSWTMKTSIDGANWINQGNPTIGTQDVLVSSGINPGLFMTDGSSNQWLDEIAVWGGNFQEFTNTELSTLYSLGQIYDLPLSQYTNFLQTVSGNVDLYLQVLSEINNNTNLYLDGIFSINNNASLYISGPSSSTDNSLLYVSGPNTAISGINLYLNGTGMPTSGGLARIIDYFITSSDYSPQIIGKFNTIPASATIQIWNVTNGINTTVNITNNTCYRIGNTNSWRWSTDNLPTLSGTNHQLFYIMTSNLLEKFEGQFFLDAPEDNRWFHPKDTNLYIK